MSYHNFIAVMQGWPDILVNRTRPATAKRLKQFEEHGVPFEPLTQPIPFAAEGEEEYLTAYHALPREPEN
jgi:hypothetical protein